MNDIDLASLVRWKRFTCAQGKSSRSGSNLVSLSVATNASKISARAPLTARGGGRAGELCRIGIARHAVSHALAAFENLFRAGEAVLSGRG